MPKPSNFPILLDYCKNIDITFLKRHGYLKPNIYKSGTINWSRNGINTSSISIASYIYGDTPYIQLSYTCEDTEKIKYKVYLCTKPSNLGKGEIWYFICPHTGKLCRKLYLGGQYFLHREAFTDVYYEKQTYSHKTRNMIKLFEKVFTDNLYEEYYKKYRKTYYKGKPTKKEVKLQKRLNIARSYPSDTYERLLVS